MKPHFRILFILAAIIAMLVGCSREQSDRPDKDPSPEASETFPADKPGEETQPADFSGQGKKLDVTAKVEALGQPFAKPLYARNVWDMQLFGGKIYLGHGNSSNGGPTPNSGAVPILYYDPAKNKFETGQVSFAANARSKPILKKQVDEEQIDQYKVLNGKLYIPGHDASGEGWDFGNFYVMDQGSWKKYRNIPDALHVYDMAYYQGKLFAGISSDGAEVLMSDNDGQSWKSIGYTSHGARAYTLFEFKDKLYAAGVFMPGIPKADRTPLLTVDGKLNVSKTNVSAAKLFPGAKPASASSFMRMAHPVEVKGKLVYIYGEVYNDHQLQPQALAVASSLDSAKRVSFPNGKAVPRDILVRGSTVYVLTNVKWAANKYSNIVYASKDLAHWSELFRFRQDAYARSFEELGGDFYFGLGTDTDMQCATEGNKTMCTNGDKLSASTGTILRVNSADYQSPKGKRVD